MAENLRELIAQTSTIEKLLTANPSASFMPTLKTIYNKVDFKIWQAKLKEQLRKLKQEGVVSETIELLTNGFKNGFTDEKDFNALKANLMVIEENLEEYQPISEEKPRMKGHITAIYGKLAKGQKIYTAFSEYELIQQIGSGGNGRVFSAKDTDGETFAIKFVEKHQSTTKLKRFKNEINFCEHHKHKNIVPVLDRGQAFLDSKEFVFYVMPLYADTLKDKIKAGVPTDKVLDIFIGLLEGLKYAHENGTIHRDIKPENIMFAKDSFEPVICDFGIAHFAEEDLLTIVETKATDRMANFQYAAPEQRKRGVNVCFQTDIYALALILNEMFTGEIPQAGGYKRIADVCDEYQYLDDVFEQLYKQNPEDRLFPESKILTEIKVLAENKKKEKDKLKLQNDINKLLEVKSFDAHIIDMKYENGNLRFFFNTNLPNDWFYIIKYESYSATFMINYSKEFLQRVGENGLSMRLLGRESDETIKKIVKNLNEWVKTVNSIYTTRLKQAAEAEQRQKEEERLDEIKRLEEEIRINSNISTILAEL